jgi:hypothetical protein
MHALPRGLVVGVGLDLDLAEVVAPVGCRAVAPPGIAFDDQMNVCVRHPLDAADDTAREILRDDIARVMGRRELPVDVDA